MAIKTLAILPDGMPGKIVLDHIDKFPTTKKVKRRTICDLNDNF